MIGNKQKDEENLMFSAETFGALLPNLHIIDLAPYFCVTYIQAAVTYMGMCLRQGSIALPLSKA